MMTLEFDSFRLPPDDQYPLFLTAKRYRSPHLGKGKGRELVEDALTLVVLHSTSFHKEIWEPSLDTLFKLANAKGPQLLEAWAIECPNHGESAPLNKAMFTSPEYATQFGCLGYAKAVHRFLTKGPISFRNRRIAGIGHSLGANAMLLLQDLVVGTEIQFESLVLVEPLISPEGISHLVALREKLVASAIHRQDTWTSRAEARRHIGKSQERRRKGKGKWDGRVLEAFANFGVVATPDGKLTLACTREQEVAMYLDRRGAEAPVEVLNRISSRTPIHLVIGKVKDFIPGHVHDALVDPASGRVYASISYMSDVGHLVPQERPDELARVIYQALCGVSSPNNRPHSKL